MDDAKKQLKADIKKMEKEAEGRQKDFDKMEEQLQNRKENLIEQITAKKAKSDDWGVELQGKRRTRDESEIYIKDKKEEISNRTKKIEELTKQVNGAKLTINMYKQQQMQSPYHKVVQQAQPQKPVAQQAAREMKKPEPQAAPVRGK